MEEKTDNSLINYEELLMQQLSRRHIDFVAHCIGDNEKEFERLMTLALHGKEPVVQRATWAMDACLDKRPWLLSPYVEKLIEALPRFTNNGARRLVAKALASCHIPEKYEGQLVDLCFCWLKSPDMQVAVKIHCMQIIANISVKYPDLARELCIVITEQIPRNSIGFASRGRKLLKNAG